MNEATENPTKIELLPPVHTSLDTAYLIKDYPYGFTLRTEMKIWVETKTTKAGKISQRVGRCTKNPKTARWNKSKFSTYSEIYVLFKNLENDGHIESDNVHEYNIVNRAGEFLSQYGTILSDKQRDSLTLYAAANYVRENAKISIVEHGCGAFYSALRDRLIDVDRKDLVKKIGA